MIPPKRLKYEKYNGCDNVIIIDLHNGYSVIAIWSQNEQEFSATLHLKDNTTDMWDLIVDDWKFTANQKSINAAILRTIADSLESGFFEQFTQRSKYYSKCAELGCYALEDQESKGDK